MPVLNRHLYEELCEQNRNYLREKIPENLINEPALDIDLNRLDDPEQIMNQLIRNEKDIVEACNKQFQKEKNKAKYTILFLSAAVAALGAGFALAPLFIVSTIVVPVLPVLLIGFAIVGITKLLLSLKVNRLKANSTQAINTLDQLIEVDKNMGQEIKSTFNRTIGEKIEAITEMNSQKFSQILVKLGAFKTDPIPIPVNESANEMHNTARASSPTHS